MGGRHQILNDAEFWTRLEYAVSRWLEDSDEQGLKGFWVDGFLPESATNTNFGADVEGVAWVGVGPRSQEQYRFVASLPQKMLHRRTPSFAIESFSLDEERHVLQIRLASAKSVVESGRSPNGGAAKSPGDSVANGGRHR